MRWSWGRFSSPRQYAPATRMSLKWPSREVEGTWGPRQRSVNVVSVRIGRHDGPALDPVGVLLVGAGAHGLMISALKGWSLKSSSPSSMEYSWRMKGWSSATISRITASMRARSSSLKCSPPGSSKS